MNFDHRQLPFQGQRRIFGTYDEAHRHFGHGGHPLAWILFAILLAVLVVLLVSLVMRLRASRRAGASAPPAGTGVAEPLAVLRLRYARGEVSRDDFLRASEDLGAPPGEAPPPS